MPICIQILGATKPSPSILCNFPHFAHYASSYLIVSNPYNRPSKYYYFPSVPGKVNCSEVMCFP